MTEPAGPPLRGLSAQIRRSPRVMLAIGAAVVAVVAYPILIERGVARIGVRGVAAAVIVASLLGSLAMRGRSRAIPGAGAAATLGWLALLAVAVVTGDPRALRSIVAFVFVTLAWVFWRSLRDGGSLLETLVRSIEPAAPDFIRSYCRKSTVLWSVFFLGNAAILAVLAWRPDPAAWESYGGRTVFAEMGVIFVVDFFVRKTWFRYYFHDGPFDRLWSSLFPAENTEAGRRSAAYIRRMKER